MVFSRKFPLLHALNSKETFSSLTCSLQFCPLWIAQSFLQGGGEALAHKGTAGTKSTPPSCSSGGWGEEGCIQHPLWPALPAQYTSMDAPTLALALAMLYSFLITKGQPPPSVLKEQQNNPSLSFKRALDLRAYEAYLAFPFEV